MPVTKIETWHSYENFRYIKVIYSETWFNFLHYILLTQCNIFFIGVSKNPIKLSDAWFFSFLLHRMHQRWPSTSCTHPRTRCSDTNLPSRSLLYGWRGIIIKHWHEKDRIHRMNLKLKQACIIPLPRWETYWSW